MGEFFRLKTFHGTSVCEDTATGEVISLANENVGRNFPVLCAYVSAVRPNVCFLISERGSRLWLQPTLKDYPPTLVGPAILPLGIVGKHTAEVSLYNLRTGTWISAQPLQPGNPAHGGLVGNRLRVNDWERMQLLRLLPVLVPSTVCETAAQIDAMLPRPLDISLLRTLQPQDAPILDAISRAAPLAVLENLTQVLLLAPDGCGVLSRLFPEDLMSRYGFPALANWLSSRDRPATTPAPAKTARPRPLARFFGATPAVAIDAALDPIPASDRSIGPEFDVIAAMGAQGEYVSFAHACTMMARRTVLPRKNLCIIATARNEGLYILDWLAYHRSIGVQQVFLYTNDNDDGSDRLLSALSRAGAVHWVRNRVSLGGDAQLKAYGHALGVSPDVLDYRWALVIDLDEYMVLNPRIFRSAQEFLDFHESSACDAVALNWVVHGPANAARWKEEFVCRRFPFDVGKVNPHIKALCRPRFFFHSTPHFPRAWCNLPHKFQANNGDAHSSRNGVLRPDLSVDPNADFAWINHYFFKSAEEYLWKWSRNRGNYATLAQPSNAVLPADFVRMFMREFSGTNPSRANPEDVATGFEAELARLKALPNVADAWAHVKDGYSKRIRTIVPLFENAPGIVEAGDAGRAFMATLAATVQPSKA